MKVGFLLLPFMLLAAFSSPAQSARKIDEYGTISNADAADRLANFAIELQNDPTAKAFIITYDGAKSKGSVAKARGSFAKNYLVKKGDIAAARIVVVEGGLKEDPWTELWAVPPGAALPKPSPTIKRKVAARKN